MRTLTSEDREPVSLLQRERPLRADLLLVIPYLMLSALGLLMIYSASAPRLEALGLDPTRDLERQALFVVLGFIGFAAASLIDLKVVRGWVPVIYGATVVMLVVVLSPIGEKVQGAQRWIPIGPYQFQPAELAKLAVVLALASLIVSAGRPPLSWHLVARAVILVTVPSLLIFLQPDLGTMLSFAMILLLMLFAGAATWRQIAFLAVAALVSTVGLFQLGAVKAYQITRLTAFLDPAADPQGAGFNLLQSEIAIGTGRLTGRGLFEGSQTNLRFIPEQSSDFIFTAVAEQLGFVGAVVVLALFAVIIWRVLVTAANARDRFGQLVAVGFAALIAFHVFVNIGMTVRLMPVTGLPLPFMSAGGTVFVAMSIALGLVHSIWLRRSPVRGERGME